MINRYIKIALFITICISLNASENLFYEGKKAYQDTDYKTAVNKLLEYVEENPGKTNTFFAEEMISNSYAFLGDSYYSKEKIEDAKLLYYAANSVRGNEGVQKCDRKIANDLAREREKEREEELNKEAENSIGIVENKLEQGKYDEVIKAYNKYRYTKSKESYRKLAESAYIEKVNIFYNSGDLRKALEILNIAKNDLGLLSNDFKGLNTRIINEAINNLIEPGSMEEARKWYKPVCYLREVLFNPGEYVNDYCEIQGTVFQNLNDGFLLDVQGRKIYCVYGGEKLFVDGIGIQAIGIVLGIETYQTTLGGSNTVPKVQILYADSFN